jgi:DNA-binding NarL/FixJ family response regulator
MEQVQKLGVDGYLTKPVELDAFLDLIRRLRRYWHADLILPHS